MNRRQLLCSQNVLELPEAGRPRLPFPAADVYFSRTVESCRATVTGDAPDRFVGGESSCRTANAWAPGPVPHARCGQGPLPGRTVVNLSSQQENECALLRAGPCQLQHVCGGNSPLPSGTSRNAQKRLLWDQQPIRTVPRSGALSQLWLSVLAVIKMTASVTRMSPVSDGKDFSGIRD